eukprot:TRINITY_DN2066_c0_g2_i1.p1 TRINITY_DN2066_c0_g2~~TRINITY_DN2066_c0_g2_i1.p1  ORF type:complete len:269 (+),score=61.41 TRINITY_DN2066_c0_g2_i1:89-808(+)
MLRSLVGSEMCIRDRSTQSTGIAGTRDNAELVPAPKIMSATAAETPILASRHPTSRGYHAVQQPRASPPASGLSQVNLYPRLSPYKEKCLQSDFRWLWDRSVASLKQAPTALDKIDVQNCIAYALDLTPEEAVHAEKKVTQTMYKNGFMDRNDMAVVLGNWLGQVITEYFNAKKDARKATGNMVWGFCFCFCTFGIWLCHLMRTRSENQETMDKIMANDDGKAYVRTHLEMILLPESTL